MTSWLGSLVIKRDMACLNDGDLRPILRVDARDVHFCFPGDSSWATDLKGRDAHGLWLQRFVDDGMQMFVDEVVVKGFPWRMTVCVRGTNYLEDAEGELACQNRYVLWGWMSWGFLKECEAYEDTQASKALDNSLESRPTHSPEFDDEPWRDICCGLRPARSGRAQKCRQDAVCS
jgi:hypothetical protein